MSSVVRPVTLAGAVFYAEAASLPAPGKDQDAVLVTEGFVGVADGATPLRPGGEDPRSFADRLLRSLANASREPTPRAVERAIAEAGGPARDDPFAPSCTFACVREFADGMLTVDVLGDCVVVAVLDDGTTRRIEDARLEAVEAPIVATLSGLLSSGRSFDEAYVEILPALEAARARRNQAGSYGVFTRDPIVSSLVVSDSLPVSHVVRVLLLTDGLARLVRTYRRQASFETLEAAVFDAGLEAVLREVRALDEDAALLPAYPRLSLVDDASAIHMRRS